MKRTLGALLAVATLLALVPTNAGAAEVKPFPCSLSVKCVPKPPKPPAVPQSPPAPFGRHHVPPAPGPQKS